MISGKKIVLKGLSKKDSPLIYKWVNCESTRNLTGTLFPISEYEHEKWIQDITHSKEKKIFSIYCEDKCIGTIGIKNIDYINRNAELFISIGENVKGAGTDAVTTLVNYCFMHLNIHKIYLHVFESNKRQYIVIKNLDLLLKEN